MEIGSNVVQMTMKDTLSQSLAWEQRESKSTLLSWKISHSLLGLCTSMHVLWGKNLEARTSRLD